MSKLLSVKLSKNFGGLVAQEIDFNETGEIIEVKGAVGSGKTSAQDAVKMALSGGNSREFDDALKYDKFDNEVCILASQKIYMRTVHNEKTGKWDSFVFQKTTDGKISKDPIIDGKKMTPAVTREMLQTELTFGAGRFISKDPRVQMAFMMETYSHKLKELGVIFDKKALEYENSILWRLDQAILDRTAKEYTKKAVNGFRNHLEAEGYDEDNIPAMVDIVSLNAQITVLNNQRVAAELKHNEDISTAKIEAMKAVQAKIDGLMVEGGELMGKITAYNTGLATEEELRRNKLSTEIIEHNEGTGIDEQRKMRILSSINALREEGCTESIINSAESWCLNENFQTTIRVFEAELANLKPLTTVPIVDGKVSDYTPNFTQEINETLIQLHRLKIEIAPLLAKKENPEQIPADPFDASPYNTETILAQIETGKVANLINDRWNAFFDHKESDEKVKEIYKEYCELFLKVDLGVPGLSMQLVGDENKSEIRTFYNAEYDPALFGNKDKEPRLLSQYSETQRPVIAMLLQKYLLDEKIAKGEDGLRAIFVEMPMDKATRLTLKRIKNEFDIDIFTSTTGDFDREKLTEGQFIIENGQLLHN